MTIRLHRRAVLLSGLVLLTAITAVVLAQRSSAGPRSTPLAGSFNNVQNFFPPACTSVTQVCSSFVASGSFQGSGVVDVDTFPDASTGFSKAHTMITTSKGVLWCDDATIVQPKPTDGQTVRAVVDLCMIDPGSSTGIYAGATGYVQEVGTVDFATGVGSLNYYGRIVYGG